jgi:DNA-binding XRE family transcriptional regulator
MRRTHKHTARTCETLKYLGLRIATARRTQWLTAAELSERAGISVPTLRNIERGVPTVAVGVVLDVASLVGVDPMSTEPFDLRSAFDTGRLVGVVDGHARAGAHADDGV